MPLVREAVLVPQLVSVLFNAARQAVSPDTRLLKEH
jgi:hypothetical protein